MVSVCVCVCQLLSLRNFKYVYKAGGHPSHQCWMATEEATGELIRATKGNGTRHTCVSVPFLLLSLF